MGRGVFLPRSAEHMERIGRNAADAVVGRPHDELRAGGDRTEFSDDEMVAKLRVVKEHIVLFKAGWVCRIVIIGIVPDGDIRGLDYILEEAGGFIFVGNDRASDV